MSEESPNKTRRGFAALDSRRQREIASLGGRAAHASGHAHEFSSEEAKAAARKSRTKRTIERLLASAGK
jgi:uncharacterized protein